MLPFLIKELDLSLLNNASNLSDKIPNLPLSNGNFSGPDM